MTTLIIDGKNKKIWSDSRTSWEEADGLFSALTGFNNKLCYKDTTDNKIQPIDNKVYAASCGRVSTVTEVLYDIRTGCSKSKYYLRDDSSDARIFLSTVVNEDMYTVELTIEYKPSIMDRITGKFPYFVERRWYKNSTLFSGSGGVYAKQSWEREDSLLRHDIEHAMYFAQHMDIYSGGDIRCVEVV